MNTITIIDFYIIYHEILYIYKIIASASLNQTNMDRTFLSFCLYKFVLKDIKETLYLRYISFDYFFLNNSSSIFTFLMGVSSVVLVRGIVGVCCKKDEEDEFTQVRASRMFQVLRLFLSHLLC